jgi:hypothetical protein
VENRPLVGSRRICFDRGDGRCVCDVQRSNVVSAATWSSVWYLLSAFAVISYTKNWAYVCFAALGSWIGAYLSMTLLRKPQGPGEGSRSPHTVTP